MQAKLYRILIAIGAIAVFVLAAGAPHAYGGVMSIPLLSLF
jgi:hypothetical protein